MKCAVWLNFCNVSSSAMTISTLYITIGTLSNACTVSLDIIKKRISRKKQWSRKKKIGVWDHKRSEFNSFGIVVVLMRTYNQAKMKKTSFHMAHIERHYNTINKIYYESRVLFSIRCIFRGREREKWFFI